MVGGGKVGMDFATLLNVKVSDIALPHNMFWLSARAGYAIHKIDSDV
jgi:hypothetical protein